MYESAEKKINTGLDVVGMIKQLRDLQVCQYDMLSN